MIELLVELQDNLVGSRTKVHVATNNICSVWIPKPVLLPFP